MSSLYAIESFTQVWRRCPGSCPLPGIRDGVSRPHQPQCCTRFPELKSAAGTGVPGSCGHESSRPPALTWSNPNSSTSLITTTLAFASPPSSTAQCNRKRFGYVPSPSVARRYHGSAQLPFHSPAFRADPIQSAECDCRDDQVTGFASPASPGLQAFQALDNWLRTPRVPKQ